jgi:hypothetical protein
MAMTFLEFKRFVCLPLLCVMPFSVQADEQSGFDYFEKHIRPMIHNECIECHGDKKQKGGLALHIKTLAMAGGDLGVAIEPGQPQKSLLMEAIERKDKDLEMPPKKELTPVQIQHFKTWISMGAPWPDDQSNTVSLPAAKRIDEVRKTHWAFQPFQGEVIHHPQQITEEVNKNLKDKGLGLSTMANPRELIRRVYLDLIGLPPSMDEVEAFASNPSEEAYAQIVEELLARSEYGERWARHWLDVARYADTMGAKVPNQSIHYPNAYTYRDYVVNAFNQDLPYDEFVHEQIAADLLKDYKKISHQKLAALGFLRVGPNFLSNHDRIDDKIDVVTRGFLGLTVSCARCHDHKTDPVTIKDYYAFYGIFNNIEIPNLENSPVIGEVKDEKLREDYYASLKEIEDKYEKELQKIISKNEALLKKDVGAYLSYFLKTESQHKSKVTNAETASLNREALKLWKRQLKKFKQDHTLFGPFVYVANANTTQLKDRLHKLPEFVSKGKYSESFKQSFASFSKKTKLKSSYDLAMFYGEFLNDRKQWGQPDAASFRDIEKVVTELPLHIPDASRGRYFTQAENSKLRKIDNQKIELAASSQGSPHRAMVVYDRSKVYAQHVFIRGDASRRGDKVDRRFLEVLNPITGGEKFPDKTSGRLQLAQSITNPSNPLTARVMMNRIWAWHFGKSLVVTPSDYGLMTPEPVQSKLLDRLAKTFIDSKWSIKAMHRLIIKSDVYKQSSELNEKAYAIDPGNEYLWRFNRQRLSLEQMRDSMLSVSGSLDLGVGGKPFDIKEFIPRRTIYAKVDRNMIPDVMVNFDAGNLSSSQASRPTTSVPQQALYLMNDDFMLSQAAKLIEHDQLKHLEGQQWLRGLFHLVYAREPSSFELQKLTQFMHKTEVDFPKIPRYQWTYGYGKFDPKNKKLESFNKLVHYNGKFWRMGETYPHPKFKYISLSASGGHTGSQDYTSVRRWTSPQSGQLEIKGTLKHAREGGDGIYGIIWSNKKGLLGEWHCYQNEEKTISKLIVEKGEVIDFISYCGKSTTCDSFSWDPEIFLKTADDFFVWKASEHFAGPMDKKLLDKREALAHILLMSNEFHFVD